MKNSSEKSPFLWGVTSIGAQTEGGCTASNWYAASCAGTVPEIGRANNYWEDYKEYHDCAEELGVSALRISLEWARIEPDEGNFDERVIAHYRDILRDIKQRDIKTVVGLFHWTYPSWCDEHKTDLPHKGFTNLFKRFVRVVRDALGDDIDMVIIFNEPMVAVASGYFYGNHPPHKKNKYIDTIRAVHTLINMHKSVYDLWKESYPQTSVGSTHLWNDVRWHKKTLWGHVFNTVTRWVRVEYVVFQTYKKSDFIGINYYTANTFFFGKSGGHVGFHGTNDWHDENVWRHFPQGLGVVLMQVAKYGLPVHICENGKPTHDVYSDEDRQVFLRECVDYVRDARKKGIDVRGYFHYALMDSYEWSSGYDFLFGLVGVNRGTLEKSKRQSFELYKEMIEGYDI